MSVQLKASFGEIAKRIGRDVYRWVHPNTEDDLARLAMEYSKASGGKDSAGLWDWLIEEGHIAMKPRGTGVDWNAWHTKLTNALALIAKARGGDLKAKREFMKLMYGEQ